MAKQNLPNSTTELNLVSEKNHYLYLYDLKPRSAIGNISFTSTTSGETYSTETYLSGYFENQGQEGLLLILKDVLKDYLITADDYNGIYNDIVEVDDRAITTQNKVDNILYHDIPLLKLKLEARDDIAVGETFGTNAIVSFGDIAIKTKEAVITNLTYPGSLLGVNDLGALAIGDEITVFDDVYMERTTIATIDVATKTITIDPPIVNTYKAGAQIKETMVVSSISNTGFSMSGWSTNKNYVATNINGNLAGSSTSTIPMQTNHNSVVITDDGTVWAICSERNTVDANMVIGELSKSDGISSPTLVDSFSIIRNAPSYGPYSHFSLIIIDSSTIGVVYIDYKSLIIKKYHSIDGLLDTQIFEIEYLYNLSFNCLLTNDKLFVVLTGNNGSASYRYDILFYEFSINFEGKFIFTSLERLRNSSDSEFLNPILCASSTRLFLIFSEISGAPTIKRMWRNLSSGEWSLAVDISTLGTSDIFINMYIDKNNTIYIAKNYYSNASYTYYISESDFIGDVVNLTNIVMSSGIWNQFYEDDVYVYVYYIVGATSLKAGELLSVNTPLRYFTINKSTFAASTLVTTGVLFSGCSIFCMPNNKNIRFTDPAVPVLLFGKTTTDMYYLSGGFTLTIPTQLSTNDMRISLGTHQEMIMYVRHTEDVTLDLTINGLPTTKEVITTTETKFSIILDVPALMNGLFTIIRPTLVDKRIEKIIGGYE